MMKRLLILLGFLLMVLTGCKREPVYKGTVLPAETGTLEIRLRTSAPATKSDTSKEGDAFHNVLVVIVDASGKVVDKVYESYSEEEKIRDVIQFTDLKVGAYQVYAYANIGHTDWQITGQTIEDVEKTLVNGVDLLGTDRRLKTLTGTDVPAQPDGTKGMLLTGEVDINVGVSTNVGEVELLRPVVRFNVFVHNHTDVAVTLDSLSFSAFNASDTYLLDHRDASGYPRIPEVNVNRKLPAYDAEHPVVIAAPTGTDHLAGRELVYSQLLYENRSATDYRMFATLSITDENDQRITRELMTEGLRLVPYEEISAMKAGDTKEVMFVNPNSSNGRFLGLSGSTLGYSEAKYTLATSFLSHAWDLYNNQQIGSYYVFTLTRLADGRFQMWHKNVNLFRNLVRADNNASNNEEALTLTNGFVPSYTDYPVSRDFEGYLCRFHDSGNRYLYNQDNKLRVNASQTDRGNRMWAFYEVRPKGSVLKFIDNETAQVKPLACMLRNQELNVVLNVYYEEHSRSFNFEVENTYWSDENAHKPSHEFK